MKKDYYPLKDKVIVITGASSGFGKGAAFELAQMGANVVLAARREDVLEDLAFKCDSVGGKALAICVDVSEKDEVEYLYSQTMMTFGKIDVWINNAGVGALGRFEDVPLDDHIKVVNTDLMGVIHGSYFAMRQFRAQGYGTLINTASGLGVMPAPYYSSYVAAKSGVVGLSAVLRQELNQDGLDDQIHVCTVLPMAMNTEWFDNAANYTGHEAAPIPPVYDPKLVVDAYVRLVTDPEDEIIVGDAGKIMVAAHAILPGTTEKFAAHQTHKTLMEKSPPAEKTSGNLYRECRPSKTPKIQGGEDHHGHASY